jgi:CRISPR-associated protein Csd1
MILQQLYRDADAILRQTIGEGLPPSMYLRKRVRYIIELNDGQPVQFTPLAGEGKNGERGLEMLVPSTKRTAGVRPLLLADKPSYVLGLRIPDPKKDAGRDAEKDTARTIEEFVAFKQLIRECAEATESSEVQQVLAFLEGWDPQNPPIPLPDDLTRDTVLTFRVGNTLLVELPAVRQFWAAYGQNEEPEEGGAVMQCLVSGRKGPVEEMMPIPVKGLPGGKSEMAIVSANVAAFESYGLERAQTSPICRDAGERFGQALNALLASPDHHATVQNATYVFWSPTDRVSVAAFQDPALIRDFVTAFRSGKRAATPDAKFYLFGLAPNAARVVVRFAMETTVAELERQQAEWFERLEIGGFDENRYTTEAAYPLKTLAVAPYREFKEITAGTADALARAALLGDPLPDTLLALLVSRCRAERSVTRPRAALIKYILSQHLTLSEAKTMTTEMTILRPPHLAGDDARAYDLGRLFAELEAIQGQAIPGINAGIADKFYGSASSTPAAVFGLLLDGVQNHLAKLRKERETAYLGAQKRIEDILAYLDDFPKTLNLKSQAYFSLGYYHYRAERRRRMMLAAEAKKAGGAVTDEAILDDPAYAQGDDNE